MEITSPCHENFGTMSKRANGRYCKSCEKVVVDFTQMNQHELIAYFEKHKHENICGRAKNTQLGKQNAFESFLFKARQKIHDKINITPLRVSLLAMISGLLAFTTSCMGKMVESHPAYRNNSSEKDTLKKETPKQPARK